MSRYPAFDMVDAAGQRYEFVPMVECAHPGPLVRVELDWPAGKRKVIGIRCDACGQITDMKDKRRRTSYLQTPRRPVPDT